MPESLPVYEQFVNRLLPRCALLGIEVHDRSGWIVLEGKNGHRIAVSRSVHRLPHVETTVPADAFEGYAEQGGLALPLPAPNGRMACRLPADPVVVEEALEFLAAEQPPVRARRAERARRGEGGFPRLDDLLAVERAAQGAGR